MVESPIPSTERTVAGGSNSVSDRTACATHSPLPCVDGVLEWCCCLFNCECNLLGNRPPDQSPHVFPFGFCKAVTLPIFNNISTSPGIPALAKSRHMREKPAVSASDSNKSRKWFAVIPDGPPAAPRRAPLMFLPICRNPNRKEPQVGPRVSLGKERCFVTKGNGVSPSANRAADNSPMWTNDSAQILFCTLVAPASSAAGFEGSVGMVLTFIEENAPILRERLKPLRTETSDPTLLEVNGTGPTGATT